MPLYEYECPAGHITEKLFPINNSPVQIDCPRCWDWGREIKTADKIWSVPGNIQIGLPTRIFMHHKTGEVFTPFSRFDKPPAGYIEKELKDPIARSKFEKEQQRKVDAENQLTSHVLDSMKSQARNNRHDNLKAKMNAIQRETITNREGKEETIEFTLDHKDKQLINKAMERSKNKPRKEKKTEVKLAINHYNPSNMDQVK